MNLDRLLRPRSIAVFGGAPAAEVIRQCRRIGYAGAIWPVHPTREHVEGLAAFRGVAQLPGAPDAAFIAVNRRQTVGIVRELAQRGAGGAVCYAAGFAESGEDGRRLQGELVEAAGAMPFLGPNCYGMINYADKVALWPDQHGGAPVGRGVAIITQSGNIGVNLTMQRRALPLAYLCTLGNQVSVDLAAMVDALARDERVSAIGLHIEGVGDPVAFSRACAFARERGRPVVAIKTGRSAAGAAMTVSHTASLAGSDRVVEAFLARSGVVRVDSVPVLLEALKVLHFHGPLPSRDIASLSCSGGEAALMADAVEPHGLRFREFTPAQKAAIEANLAELVTVSNPFDYHTFAWGDEAALARIFASTMRAGFATTLLVLDYPREDRCSAESWDTSARAMIRAAKETGARAAIVASLPECMPEDRALTMAAAGVLPLFGLDDALAALDAAARVRDLPPALAQGEMLAPSAIGGEALLLSEWGGKQVLREHGLAIPAGVRIAHSRGAAGDSAIDSAIAAVGFPAVLKAVGRGIAHKTEIGAVKLGLRTREAVLEAAAALEGTGEHLLLEQMIPDAVAELIVGVSRDPVLGLHLVIGAGGQLVEWIGDSAVLLLPSSREAVRAALLGLRAARLLQGYRNRPQGDIEAVVDAAMAVQAFAIANADRLAELDINPLMVRPQGRGAVAADVLLRMTEVPS